MWFEKTWCQYSVINSLVLHCLPKTWIHFSCKCYTHVPAICLMESVSKTTQMSYSGSIASYQQTYPIIGFNHINLPQWAQFYGSYCTLYGQHANTMNISRGQRWTKSTLGFHSPHFFEMQASWLLTLSRPLPGWFNHLFHDVLKAWSPFCKFWLFLESNRRIIQGKNLWLTNCFSFRLPNPVDDVTVPTSIFYTVLWQKLNMPLYSVACRTTF